MIFSRSKRITQISNVDLGLFFGGTTGKKRGVISITPKHTHQEEWLNHKSVIQFGFRRCLASSLRICFLVHSINTTEIVMHISIVMLDKMPTSDFNNSVKTPIADSLSKKTQVKHDAIVTMLMYLLFLMSHILK